MNASRRPSFARQVRPAALAWRVGLLWLVWAGAAVAQAPVADPPGRVARVAELVGPVWLFHPDNGDWTEAVRNIPLTTGDRLAADPGARAELQVGSTTLRLDGGSELEVVALDDTRIAVQLHAGALATRVRDAAEAGQVDMLTDDGRFLVLRAGSYRFDRGTRSSFATVDAGELRYEYAASALDVGPGQRAEFWIDTNGAAQYALVAPVADAFAAWNAERDRDADRSIPARYVSPAMTGALDLDRYGTWEQTPDYGAVWVPTAVAVDWVPYGAGHWAWVRPWGWTWVDDAPWGFAPFHYGRWVQLRNRWCWAPGAREPRPVWAPALVGWVGGGAPAGRPREGGPPVGWFPLAPREVYLPAYASTPRYVRGINQAAVRNPALVDAALHDPRSARDFENRRFPRAVTVVPANVLAEHRPVAPVAAQYRDTPWAREIARQGGPGRVSALPPVAPPSVPPVGDLRRPSRPPPGFAVERGGRPDGVVADRDASRPAMPPTGAADQRRPYRSDRETFRDERAAPSAGRTATAGVAGQSPPAGLPAGGVDGRGGLPRPSVADTAGRAQPAAVEPAPSQRMRALPVRRGDDARLREEGARPTVRSEPPAAARPQVDAPATSIAPVRPVESPRAAERSVPTPPQVAPRTAEIPGRQMPSRPSETVAPRAAEPAPQRPAESPRAVAPERRTEPGANR